MVDWEDIHKDFGEKDYSNYPKTYQQSWEENNFTYQDAQEWISLEFEPKDYDLIKEWKNHNFTSQETECWIDIGLIRMKDAEFTAYLRSKGYRPNQYLNLIKLRKEFKVWLEKGKPAQEYLDIFYPKSRRNTIKKLDIGKKNLTGNLDLSDFVNLERLDCRYNQLTTLNLTNCQQLKELNCSNNQLTNLDLTNCQKLEAISCYDNSLFDLILPSSDAQLAFLNISGNNFSLRDLSMFSHLVNLERLYIGSDKKEKINQGICNRFFGSLKPLQNLTKLKELDISNTNIDSGLEYLPDGLKGFYCLADIRRYAKCQIIANLFANEQGKVEEWNRNIENFPQQFQNYKQWRKLNFSEEEIKQWIKTGLKLNEYEIANYLRHKDYQANTSIAKEIIAKESWQDIHRDFDYQLRKEWESKGFNEEKTKEWIIAGAKLDDYEFVAWFRNTKKLGSEWITNYKEDYQILSERFKKYGLCSECQQLNTGEQWCRACNLRHLQKNLEKKWYNNILLNKRKVTSHNPQIDQFIQKYQLEATEANKFLEWIPYKQFTNVEYLAQGGFGKVYKAKWTEGNIHHWDTKNKQWSREKDHYYKDENKKYEWNKKYKTYREVVLKSLNNSQENTDFLQETAKHKDIDDWFNNIVPCYGLSRDPKTGNYLMVMKYMPEGNLRNYLSNKNKELSLWDKLCQLVNISRGLKDLHQKNLVHRDFHSGNILKGVEKTSCLITDLGLCKPINEESKEDKTFGVMPYVAPEVLCSKPYTQASDIYSFGIVAYELLSGLPPYYDKKHDQYLGLVICQGLRPQFQIKIPPLLEGLIKRCWDAEPENRPTANELERILRGWEQGNTEFIQQLQGAEEFNKTLPDNIKFPDYQKKIHTGACYHSQLLPTGEITRLLQDSGQIGLSISSSLDQLNLNEETQQQEQQAQILQPTNHTALPLLAKTTKP